jgi:aminoglycoside phosphotransferase (APT) family kinase protein
MVATCAHAAAVLHTSGLEIGPVRTLDGELTALEREVASAQQFVPSFGERAHAWLERIAASAAQSEPLELRLGHGDFNHGQLLFDAAASALLDLDTLCRAEPALDLGKFVAHLRAETEKLRRRASVSSRLGEELAEQFLRAYVAATGLETEDERALRARTALYEAMALVRLAVRSQHDFEQTRLEIATGLLEERLSALTADPLVSRRRT